MTKDDIIRMAREYFLSEEYTQFGWQPFSHYRFDENELIDFFSLVAAAEREECAKIAEEPWKRHPREIGEAIRARGQV